MLMPMGKGFFRFVAFTAVALAVALTESCTSSSERKAGHVIVLGFDGLAGFALDSADVPCLRSLMEEGSWTTRKRSVLPTSSAVNWASMFMGGGPDATGYIDWDTKEPAFTPAALSPSGHVPTVFTLMREKYPLAETGCAFQWDGICHVVDTSGISMVGKFEGTEDGIEEQLAFVADYIKNSKPELAAFVWDYPDHTGHSVGWYTGEYYSMLKRLDAVVSGVKKAIEEAGMMDDTVLIITSDHGGHQKGHGASVDSDLFSPLIFYGKGIRRGVEISGPVYQYDVAATIADILGLDIPSYWRGKPAREIFSK